MSLRTLLAIATALSTAYLAVSAPPRLEGRQEITLDCPQGTSQGYKAYDYTYTGTQEAFYSKIGSFHHGEWYTGPLVSITGTDNTPGATRTYVDGAVQQLTKYTQTPTRFALEYNFISEPFTFEGAYVTDYVQEQSATSICGENATLISFKYVLCTDNIEAVDVSLAKITSRAIGRVADELSAVAFTGVCP